MLMRPSWPPWKYKVYTKGRPNLEQKIVVNGQYDFREEAMKGTPMDKLITIGSIADIAAVRYINTGN